MHRQSKIQIVWSADFAYAIGVIATDGNLSPNGRTVNITSKDLEMIENVKECLGSSNKIGRKANGTSLEKIYYVLQCGDINFYEFLNSIGLVKNKSKLLGKINVPKDFFRDFLRGCFGGDGNISVSEHPGSKHSQLRIRLCSASINFLNWIKFEIESHLKIKSGWIYSNARSMHVLSYGKKDSIKILKNMYYDNVKYFLGRKYIIALPFIQ
jgi:hypothetical protein